MSLLSGRKRKEALSSNQHGQGPLDSDRHKLSDFKHLLSTDLSGTPDGMMVQAIAHSEVSSGVSLAFTAERDIDIPIPPGDLSRKLKESPPLKERKRLFDKSRKAYKEHKDQGENDPVRVFEWAIIAKFLERIGVKGKTILDLGTGTGLLMRLLNEDENNPDFKEYARIYGVDFAGELLQEAVKYFNSEQGRLDPNRVFFLQGLMSEQILENASCDLITAINVLDGIPDDEVLSTLNHSFAMLKDHGHMVILLRDEIRHKYYASQGKVRNKGLSKDEEGAYKVKWQGAGEEGVVEYFRSLDTWGDLLSRNFFYIENGQAVIGHFEIQSYEKTVLTRDEAMRHPDLAKRYFELDPETGELKVDPLTGKPSGERRAAGMVIVLEKHIDNVADIN